MNSYKKGDRVILMTPNNPQLDRTGAVVLEVHPWGCVVDAPASASGTYRAVFAEMEPITYEPTPEELHRRCEEHRLWANAYKRKLLQESACGQ